jgi:hypothetical protein
MSSDGGVPHPLARRRTTSPTTRSAPTLTTRQTPRLTRSSVCPAGRVRNAGVAARQTWAEPQRCLPKEPRRYREQGTFGNSRPRVCCSSNEGRVSSLSGCFVYFVVLVSSVLRAATVGPPARDGHLDEQKVELLDRQTIDLSHLPGGDRRDRRRPCGRQPRRLPPLSIVRHDALMSRGSRDRPRACRRG